MRQLSKKKDLTDMDWKKSMKHMIHEDVLSLKSLHEKGIDIIVLNELYCLKSLLENGNSYIWLHCLKFLLENGYDNSIIKT